MGGTPSPNQNPVPTCSLGNSPLIFSAHAAVTVLRWIPTNVMMRTRLFAAFLITATLGLAIAAAQQSKTSDDAGRITALELAWNRAIEAKDAKALEMLFADSFLAVDVDGSVTNKAEYLAGIQSSDFQPSQAVNEESKVHVYGDSAVALGIFRIKENEKGKVRVHRQRTVDTWVRLNGTWKCVAAVAVELPAKPPAN